MVKKSSIVASLASTQAAIISNYNDVPNPAEKIVNNGLVIAPGAHDFWFARECMQNPLFDIGPVADISASHPNVLGEEDGLVISVRGVNGSTRMALNIDNNEVVGHCLIRPKNGAPIEFVRRSAPVSANNKPITSFKMNDETFNTDVVMGFSTLEEALSSLGVAAHWDGIKANAELQRLPLTSPTVVKVSMSSNRLPHPSSEESETPTYVAAIDVETAQGWEEVIVYQHNDVSGDNDRGVSRFGVYLPTRNLRVLNKELELEVNFLHKSLVALVRDNSTIDWKNHKLKLTKCGPHVRLLSTFTRALQDSIPQVFTAPVTEEMLKIRAAAEGHTEPLKREDVRAFMQSINEEFYEVPFDETPHPIWTFKRIECTNSLLEAKKAPKDALSFRTKAAARATLEGLKAMPKPTAPVHVNLETSFPNRLTTFPPVNFAEKDSSVERGYMDKITKARNACQDVGLYQGQDQVVFTPTIVAPNVNVEGSSVPGSKTQAVSQMRYTARLPGGQTYELSEVISIVEEEKEEDDEPAFSPARLSVVCLRKEGDKVVSSTEGYYDFTMDFITDPATKPRPPAGVAYVDQVTVLPYGEFDRMQKIDLDDMEHLRLLSDMPLLHFHPLGGPLPAAFQEITSGLCGKHVEGFDSSLLTKQHFTLARTFSWDAKTELGMPSRATAFEMLFDDGIVRAVVNQERLSMDDEEVENPEDIRVTCESYDVNKMPHERISRQAYDLKTAPQEVQDAFLQTRNTFGSPFRLDLNHASKDNKYRLLTLNELGTAPASLLKPSEKKVATLAEFDALYADVLKTGSLDAKPVDVRAAALKAIPFLYSDSLRPVDPYDGKPESSEEDTEEKPTPAPKPTDDDEEEGPDGGKPFPILPVVGGFALAAALCAGGYWFWTKRGTDKRTPLLDAAASSMVETGQRA